MIRILVIDDSETFRLQLIEGLSEFAIITAEDGLSGLKKLEQHNNKIDLIICDMNMPHLDGLGFCKKKFSDPRFKNIPVIMVTTESNLNVKQEAKQYGVKAWMLKPIDIKSLLIGVTTILASSNLKETGS